jgi:hypothetical protein
MAKRQYEIRNIGELDSGSIANEFDIAMRHVLFDTTDRPTVSKPRKVTLEVSLVPVVDERNGVIDRVKVTHKIKETLPPKQCVESIMLPTKAGLQFSTNDPDARQSTFEDEQERTADTVTE